MFGRRKHLQMATWLLVQLLLEPPGSFAAHQVEPQDEASLERQAQDKQVNETTTTSQTTTTTPSSQGGPAEQVPPYMQHMTIILVCLHLSVFITGLVGNSLVCLSVLRNKSLQTVTNYYIVNLAVADFLVILICLPPTVYWDLTLTWNFGLILCKLVLYLQSISVSVSVLTLTCISIDRWYAICRPLEFSSTKYRAKITICLIWLLSMLIASPDAIFLTTKPLYEEDDYVYTDCTYSWPESSTKIYQLCIVTLLFVGPFVLMSISYSHIVNVLWRNEVANQSAIEADESHTMGTQNGGATSDCGNIPSTSAASLAAATIDQRQESPKKASLLGGPDKKIGTTKGENKKRRRKRKKWGGNHIDDDNHITTTNTNRRHQSMTGAPVGNELSPAASEPGRLVVVVVVDDCGGGELDQQRTQPAIVELKQTHKQQQNGKPIEIASIDRGDNDNKGSNDDAIGDTYRHDESFREQAAGNELRNCLVRLAGRERADEALPSQRSSGGGLIEEEDEEEMVKEKLIPNQSDPGRSSKSSCIQLSGHISTPMRASITTMTRTTTTTTTNSPSTCRGEGGTAGRQDDDDEATPCGGGAGCGSATSGVKRDQVDQIEQEDPDGRNGKASGVLELTCTEPLRDDESGGASKRQRQGHRRCCCCFGLLPGRIGLASSAHEDDLVEPHSCLAKLAASSPVAATATATTTPTNIKDGTTSKKYRRNLANYATKRDKYRPSSEAGSMKAKLAARSKQLSGRQPPEMDSTSNNNNGCLARQSCDHHHHNDLHLQSNQQQLQQPQQQQPNYLSSSSNNNARFYKLIESRKKAAKMLIVIVIMFGLCYLPIHFLNTLRYTIGLPQNDITTIASLVSHWLCYFNSAINPLIYNLMSGKFRKEFADLFFCRCFRRQN